jgi:preprotein translocase subunit SecA
MSSAGIPPLLEVAHYPEATDPMLGPTDQLGVALVARVKRSWGRAFRDRRLSAPPIRQRQSLSGLSDEALRTRASGLAAKLRKAGCRRTLRREALAIAAEAARRALGCVPSAAQIRGAAALLEGLVAGVEPGEGKTLTTALAASVSALSGLPVHVVTRSDLLAERHAAGMRPLYEWLGLKVGVLGTGLRPSERRRVHRCEVVCASARELAFDYLRDRLLLGGASTSVNALRIDRLKGRQRHGRHLFLRGLQCAYVDDIDVVLIDEARRPMALMGESADSNSTNVIEQALRMVAPLQDGEDFWLDHDARCMGLTHRGRERLALLGATRNDVWAEREQRERLAVLALTATHLFVRDQHYRVVEGGIELLAEAASKVAPDRDWAPHLLRFIEIKEADRASLGRTPKTRSSFQRIFLRYLRLAGTTSQVSDVADELWSVYGLAAVPISGVHRVRRQRLRSRIHRTAAEKWADIAASAAAISVTGRPVLIGIPSEQGLEALSRQLTAAAIAHRCVRSDDDEHLEAAIQAAGNRGSVTVIVGTAGHGLDIAVDEDVARLGGVHVVVAERHGSARADTRQWSRGGRRGMPGSFQFIVSLEDPLVVHCTSALLVALAGTFAHPDSLLSSWLGDRLFDTAQRRIERKQAQARRDLAKFDRRLTNRLAFAGAKD